MNSEIRRLLEDGLQELRRDEEASQREQEERDRAREAESKARQQQRVEDLFKRGLPECLRSAISYEDQDYGRVILRVEGLAPIWAYLDTSARLYFRVPYYRRNWDDNADRQYAFADFASGNTVGQIGRALALARRAEAERQALEEEIAEEAKQKAEGSPVLVAAQPAVAELLESAVRAVVLAVVGEREE